MPYVDDFFEVFIRSIVYDVTQTYLENNSICNEDIKAKLIRRGQTLMRRELKNLGCLSDHLIRRCNGAAPLREYGPQKWLPLPPYGTYSDHATGLTLQA